MGGDRDHDMSAPPSPPPPAMPSEGTGRHAAMPSEPDGSRALRIALALREQVGSPPNPVTGKRAEEGTLWHVLAGMQAQLARLEDTTAKILARLADDDTAGGKRRSWLAARGERLLDAMLLIALAALLAYLGGFHR